ncbi:MAG TPA: TlpA disulfide reductase family protein [Desulfosporosinus sp.]|nr:TlpA disulfide reductase family protein [Desulfosporosinus sp.]
MKKGMKWSILLVGLALVFAGAIYVTNRPTATVDELKSGDTTKVAPQVGYRVPSFTLPSLLDNKPISLADYQGKPLLINFWASWCPPCEGETPDLVKAYAKYGDKVQFIGVDLASQDTLSDVTTFVKNYGMKYPILLDTKGAVAEQYQIMGIPTSFFVNREGIIVDTISGPLTPQVLEKDLQKISQ